MIKRLLLTSLLALWSATAIAQWQVPSGSIPVGRGAGVTGFNTVLGSGGTGTKCLLDTNPPTFGSCASVAGAALTKVDDTNVTLTLTGTPATALLQAVQVAAGWTGQLGVTRGGTGFALYAVGDLLYADTTTTLAKLPDIATGNVLKSGGVGVAPVYGKVTSSEITAAALTKVDDTNVTATLGGAPATALVNAASITLGWTGQLALGRGGTGGATQQAALNNIAPTPTRAGDVIYYNGTNWVALAGNNAGTKILQEDASGVPTWITANAGTVTQIICGTGLTGGTITGSGTCAIDKATAANLEAGTSNKVLTADNIFDAEVTITFAASQTLDFNTFLNARITATANTTSLTCSNIKASQSGVITWVQDGTGSRTMVAGWCTQFRWATGARGVLSTAINAEDALYYQCPTSSKCFVSLGKAQAN